MIPKTWYPWLILGVVVALGFAAWYINDRAYNKGYDAKKAEYEKALFEANQKIQFEQAKVARGYDIASKKIREAPDGGCVGPASGLSTEWLRRNYIGQ